MHRCFTNKVTRLDLQPEGGCFNQRAVGEGWGWGFKDNLQLCKFILLLMIRGTRSYSYNQLMIEHLGGCSQGAGDRLCPQTHAVSICIGQGARSLVICCE